MALEQAKNTVPYHDLVPGKFYRFITYNRQPIIIIDNKGHTIVKVSGDVQFFLLSTTLKFQFGRDSLGQAINVLLVEALLMDSEDVSSIIVCNSFTSTGEPVIYGTFTELTEDD